VTKLSGGAAMPCGNNGICRYGKENNNIKAQKSGNNMAMSKTQYSRTLRAFARL
jgi:hypothetical protein